MSDVWLVILVVGVCTVVFKALGPVAIGGRDLPLGLRSVVALLAPTLLAALVVSTFASGRSLALDARGAGIAAAAVAIVLRAPLLVTVAAAAMAAALVRALA